MGSNSGDEGSSCTDTLYAVDASTGALDWSFTNGGPNAIEEVLQRGIRHPVEQRSVHHAAQDPEGGR